MADRDDITVRYDVWHAEATHALDYRHREIRAQLALGPDLPPPPDDYRYVDPVDDPAWPRITATDPDDPPDAFPRGWGAAPTERDQAAIDAGNA